MSGKEDESLFCTMRTNRGKGQGAALGDPAKGKSIVNIITVDTSFGLIKVKTCEVKIIHKSQ
jgi:hypothetical protein